MIYPWFHLQEVVVTNDDEAKTRCFSAPKLDEMQSEIVAQCDAIRALLLSKNRKYGNTAANPAMVFSNASPLDQIAVRCDDKLNRIRNMGGLVKVVREAKDAEEDTVIDLIGYLILARATLALEKVDLDCHGDKCGAVGCLSCNPPNFKTCR
jgi:hypothetical protein